MSQHASLRVDNVGTKHRNVLKRHERIKRLVEDNRMEGRDSVYNLPKLKSLKIKVKKAAKAAPAEGAAAAPGGAAPAPAADAAKTKKPAK
ncbi:MAG: hypothetical protein A2Z83_09755 [Omnitrophica bacterium GWA2_52_8]|nr:MAG: hypothetical protein A2Z83_09755 [Omnitrophica bacterium GWA2_52_8]